MSIQALVHNFLDLHNTIAINSISHVDQKVKQVIEEYDLLKPDNQELDDLYQEDNLAGRLAWATEDSDSSELMEEVRNFESILLKKVSKIAPEVEKLIDRQDRFSKACQMDSALDGSDLSPLESILKEGSVDFNAISIFKLEKRYSWDDDTPPLKPSSLLAYVLSNASNDRLLTFLFQNGLKVNNENHQEHQEIIDFLIINRSTQSICGSNDLLESLLRAGLDFKTHDPLIAPAFGADITLLSCVMKNHDDKVLRNFVYYGAGDLNNEILFSTKEHSIRFTALKEALKLREEMLEKMQKHLSPIERKKYQDLSAEDRIKLARLCHETQRFRDAFIKPGEADKDLQERIALHKAFIHACLEGNFKEAEKLLPHGIDINANFIPHPEFKKEFYPLLNHACMQGDVKLVEFLLKHGAKCNIGSDDYIPHWLPPIFQYFINKPPNKQQILSLLLKAGANINERSATRHWASLQLFRTLLWKTTDKKELFDELSLCGFDINIQDLNGSSFMFNVWNNIEQNINKLMNLEIAKLLIYYGVDLEDWMLDWIKQHETLNEAFNLRNQAMRELLRGHLKELEALKPLSMDLINIIGDYTVPNVQLTPEWRVDLAKRIRKEIEDLKPMPSNVVDLVVNYAAAIELPEHKSKDEG